MFLVFDENGFGIFCNGVDNQTFINEGHSYYVEVYFHYVGNLYEILFSELKRYVDGITSNVQGKCSLY